MQIQIHAGQEIQIEKKIQIRKEATKCSQAQKKCNFERVRKRGAEWGGGRERRKPGQVKPGAGREGGP